MLGAAHIAAPATRWPAVALITGAGMVAAFQAGKPAIAAPLLQSDLGIGLAQIGWLTGIFAVIGLVGGIPTGAMVASRGGRRILILGLIATALGAGLGAAAPGFPLLLISRIVEGAGFLMITVAAPAMLEHVTRPQDRDTAFALWACFMPAGMTLAMLAGPLFEGWRMFWWASLALTLLACLAVALVVPSTGGRQPWSGRRIGADTLGVIRAGGPVVLALLFALFSMMFFALFSFLPVLLMERMGVTLRSAGHLSALVTAVAMIGNLSAGYLLSRGAGRAAIVGAQA